jgi:hypothetical protein
MASPWLHPGGPGPQVKDHHQETCHRNSRRPLSDGLVRSHASGVIEVANARKFSFCGEVFVGQTIYTQPDNPKKPQLVP